MDSSGQTPVQQSYTALFQRLHHTANAKYFSGMSYTHRAQFIALDADCQAACLVQACMKSLQTWNSKVSQQRLTTR